MISINKDFNKPPNGLISREAEKAIEALLSEGSEHRVRRDVYMNASVFNALKDIYHRKCAFCESKPSTQGIMNYRPISSYYWLAYEWSNLLPGCPSCNNSKNSDFPVDGGYVAEPQEDRREWRADSRSFMKEKARLLHPEIDHPEEHLYFKPDGKIYGRDARGNIQLKLVV